VGARFQPSLLAGGEPAVAPDARFERVRLDDASWIDVARGWLRGSDALLETLVRTVPWQQRRRRMYDRVVDDPRLSCWYEPGAPLPHPVLGVARDALTRRYGVPFGATGLNHYRGGRDSVAFHRDRELRDLDTDALVAILSVGTRRSFLVRRGTAGPSLDLAPDGGDLLVMGGRGQIDWYHSVPKRARCGPRVSVTWRWRPDPGTGSPRDGAQSAGSS
jgi:alkylated DNA repair dioxygenase AlkB